MHVKLLMRKTRSGDYTLPGPLKRRVGQCLVSVARFVPPSLRARYVRGRSYYQVFEGEPLADKQGLSINKWDVMQMPANLRGKSILDIGCADGFFCDLCSRRGATVTGIDTAIGRLLRARCAALNDGLSIEYRFDVFPSRRIGRQFDYVLCLSVLHHSLETKDLWKVLSTDSCAEDHETLHDHLRELRRLTAPGGRCVIELPYEYEDQAERQRVDFERFNQELRLAGFRDAACLGTWEHNEKLSGIKDRVIYVAQA